MPLLYEVASHVKQLPFRPLILLLSKQYERLLVDATIMWTCRKSYFNVCRARWPGSGDALVTHAKMAMLALNLKVMQLYKHRKDLVSADKLYNAHKTSEL